MGEDKLVRLLIVDDIAETRENIRKLLQFDRRIEIVGAAKTGREAIQLAKETNPDVVLMDINMPDMDGIAATEAIREKVPYAQIVILSVQGDPNYMRRAMLAGARDFLTKPPMIDELTSAIHRAGAMAIEERDKVITSTLREYTTQDTGITTIGARPLGIVIAIYSPKGGTGCTTLTTNLGILMHSEETKVVIVDADLQFGDVAVFLNERGKHSILDLASRSEELDSGMLDNVLIKHNPSGIKVLAAPSSPELAEKVDASQFIKIIDFLKHIYTYVIIDTATVLSEVTLSALDICDVLILISTQSIPSINNSRMFLNLVDDLGIERSHILFIINRYNRRSSLTPAKIGAALKHNIAAVIPDDEETILPSVNRGKPFVTDNKTIPVVRSYLNIVEVIREKYSERK